MDTFNANDREIVRGDLLKPHARQHALDNFISRWTKDHKPQWVKDENSIGRHPPVQFASDDDWLHHSTFVVMKGSGDIVPVKCESDPTYPDGRRRHKWL